MDVMKCTPLNRGRENRDEMAPALPRGGERGVLMLGQAMKI